MKKLLEQLEKRLTPNTDRQPAISAESWQIHWQPDMASSSTECIGILLKAGQKLYWRTPEDDELSYWHTDEQQLLATLLDAAIFQFATGATNTPLGICLKQHRESAGETIREILDYLWKLGPEQTMRKKKARYPHDKQEVTSLSSERKTTHYRSGEVPTPRRHDEEPAADAHNN